jgi:hypothetical protein
MTKSKSKLYLQLCVGIPQKCTRTYIDSNLFLCSLDSNGEQLWMSTEYGSSFNGFSTNEFYSGLRTVASVDQFSSSVGALSYHDHRDNINLDVAESMVKTLRSIDKKVQKARFWDADFAEKILVIGTALKVSGIIIIDRFKDKPQPLIPQTTDYIRQIEKSLRLECKILDEYPIGSLVRIKTNAHSAHDFPECRSLADIGDDRLVEIPIFHFKDQVNKYRNSNYFADVMNLENA